MILRTSRSIRILSPVIGIAVMAAGSAAPARAQISFVDMFRSNTAQQTGNGNTLNPGGSFLSLELTSVSPGDFTSGQATTPGPVSPVSLAQVSPAFFRYQTGFYANQAAMDADFPMGTYQITGLGGTQGPLTATLDYTADHYPTQQPYLAGTGYSSLQGVNAATAISLQFSPFAPDANVTSQLQFFTIFDDTTNMFTFDSGSLPQSATGVTIAANTLTPGDMYTYELIDSNRFDTTGLNGAFPPFIGFDLRTNGTFTTAARAVPEPGSFTLIAGLGLIGSAFLRRKRAR